MNDDAEPRLNALEAAIVQVRHDLYGNGREGITETVRRLAATIDVNEAHRVSDRADASMGIKEINVRLSKIEEDLLVTRGGWRVARLMAGFLVPLFLGLLSYIAVNLNALVASGRPL